MASPDGRLELDRAVESIRVGVRHRRDMGDLDELAASIERLGLLQPITISPDGTLICGARRLAAIKRLGWKRVKVWVRSGISTHLERLLAEQHENSMRKPFTPTEAAALYRELKALMAEDAARRQEATRFHPEGDTAGGGGDANLAAPSDRTTRAQAAQLVTGRKSYTTLERVGEMEHLATAPGVPDQIQQTAQREVAKMDADGNVYGHYTAVKAAEATAELDALRRDPTQPAQTRHMAADERDRLPADDARPDELMQLAQQALARVQSGGTPRTGRPGARPSRRAPKSRGSPPRRRFGARAFWVTWSEMTGWDEDYDPAEIGPALTHEQWVAFEAIVAATVAFAEQARQARAAAASSTEDRPQS